MRKIFFVILTWISAILLNTADSSSSEINVEFTSVHPDSIQMDWIGYNLIAGKMFPSKETIHKYPDHFTVKGTYFLNLQEYQTYFEMSKRGETRARIKEIFGESWIQQAPSLYSEKEIDPIISICLVEDKSGNEFVIFDRNNDEDFSNDVVLDYEIGMLKVGPVRELKTQTVETTARAEYFNGKQILTKEVAVSFRKVHGNRIHIEGAIRKIEIGRIQLSGVDWQIALVRQGMDGLEYSKFDMLWIDSNQNNKADSQEDGTGDHIFQMNVPFTFLGKTYEVTDIDRFGKKIVVVESDKDVVPPIERGAIAPDFSEATIDSTKFSLSASVGKYILLDFWGTWCGPCIAEIPYLKAANEQFFIKGLTIVSIGLDPIGKLQKFTQSHGMNWTHISQDTQSPLLKLYQVNGYPSTFLIGKDGVILAMDNELQGENLIYTLRKHIK